MKTQKVYLEHSNITVTNLEEGIHFFQTAFPEFSIRGGKLEDNWVHFGDDFTYIALQQSVNSKLDKNSYDNPGINHLAFVVEDIKSLVERLESEGYKKNYPSEYHEFRTREYYLDADGNEYEFIEYHSNNPEERNQYDD